MQETIIEALEKQTGSADELHEFYAWAEHAIQGNYEDSMEQVMTSHADILAAWQGMTMTRLEAAELFLEKACPLLRRTDYTCSPNPFNHKREIKAEYEECVEKSIVYYGMTEEQIQD